VSPDRRSRVEALFEVALEQPTSARRVWLERASRGDAALREQVMRMLDAHERAAGILERPVHDIAARWIADAESARGPAAGDTLGPYHVLREVGRGGMGVVYQATHLRLGRPAALKLLVPQLAEDREARDRFIHEARAASALDHPNICTIYDIGETDDGRVFLAMAWYDGESLRATLDRGPLPVQTAIDYAAQITRALVAAHEAGIVHRDVKPANLMVTADGLIKLLDFGVAKLAGQPGVTQPGTHVGTAAYMSPEQARGEPVDQRTDIWSLGVVLHEMIAGERPFRGGSEPAVVRSILDDPPAPLTAPDGAVPDDLARLAGACLEKDPARRPASAAKLLHALQALRPGDAPPAVWLEHRTASDAAVRAIAVLPFADLSPDAAQGYLCEGMAEELLHALARVDGLRVASRLRQTDLPTDARMIGKVLDVDTLVEGSVRKAGPSIRVTVRLVRVADASLLWSDRYDRELKDVFAIQEDIAQSVVRVLRLTLGGAPLASLRAARTERVEAYEHYLKGRQYFLRDTRRDLEFARKMFTWSIGIDPGYARAYAGLADACAFLYKHFDRDDALLDEADQASRTAIELDATSADAHTSRAVVHWLRGRLADAEAEFEEAIRHDPASFEAHYLFGMCCYSTGRPERAIALFSAAWAQRTDDFQPPILIGALYRGLGRETEARRSFRRGLELASRHVELDPDNVRARYQLAFACIGTGRNAEGLEWARTALEMAPNDAMVLYNVAAVHTLADRPDDALDYLERAVEGGFAYRPDLEFDPDLSALRSHARFQALLERLS
jgi:serine/threonine protein kinase/tetratricopeptide (TPR) repeat protein